MIHPRLLRPRAWLSGLACAVLLGAGALQAAIHVTSATYGPNCHVSPDNAGNALRQACDGRDRCDYIVDYKVLGDPSPGCAKTFIVQWSCTANGPVRNLVIGAEAGFGSHAVLTCPKIPADAVQDSVNQGVSGAEQINTTLGVELAVQGSQPFTSGASVPISWKLTNTTIRRSTGSLRVTLDGQTRNVTGIPGSVDLQPQQQTGNSFTLPALGAGNHTVTLIYLAATGRTIERLLPDGRRETVPVEEPAGSAEVNFTVAAEVVDDDRDGLPDTLEANLLDTYRPQLRLSRNTFYGIDGGPEPYRPTEVSYYLRRARIAADDKDLVAIETSPGRFDRLLQQNHDSSGTCRTVGNNKTCSSDVTLNRRKTNYRINATDDAMHGNSWDQILSARNVGLYGHVVPYDQDSSQGDFRRYLSEDEMQVRRTHRLVKVEYWQFFGFNGGVATHEGDWCTVQLLVDLDASDDPEQRIVWVAMYAHGVEMAYHVSATRSVADLDNGTVRELRGPNYDKPIGFGAGFKVGADKGIEWAQDHKLRFLRDPVTGKFVHPVCFVESQSHEFWPSADWNFYGAASHNGSDAARSYLANRPPNLGEVEHPLHETPDADNILRYNGYWGRDSANGPPEGPALHANWTWPKDSSIRWQLSGLGF